MRKSSGQASALAANVSETSVSGISSGAYMAGGFQIARSKIVSGAAIIAGSPYGCAESAFADIMTGPGLAFLNLSKAVNGCMLNALALWSVPNVELLAEKTHSSLTQAASILCRALSTINVYLFSAPTIAPSFRHRQGGLRVLRTARNSRPTDVRLAHASRPCLRHR